MSHQTVQACSVSYNHVSLILSNHCIQLQEYSLNQPSLEKLLSCTPNNRLVSVRDHCLGMAAIVDSCKVLSHCFIEGLI